MCIVREHPGTPEARPCSCGQPAVTLCDYRVGGYGVSCDASSCQAHTFKTKDGRDLCPRHQKIHLERKRCA
jgi:hypothetical protein